MGNNFQAGQWTADQVATLKNLHTRFMQHHGKGRGLNGRNMSERQYVVARFRSKFNTNRTDAAIWAKYQRVAGIRGNDGRLLAKSAAAKLPAVRVPATYKDASGLMFTSGMKMNDWADLGLAVLGTGASRKVYDLGNVVLKTIRVGGFLNGKEANKLETETWAKVANTPDAKYFANVIAACPEGNWVIMEKVQVGADEASRKQLVEVAKRHGIRDIHGHNIGRRGATPVVLDYAYAL